MTRDSRAVFTLRIAGKPGTAGIHALKFLLKRLLRQHGFVALDVREETEPITYTQVFTQLRDDVARRSGAHSPHHDKSENRNE
jgi:hypothetical protein